MPFKDSPEGQTQYDKDNGMTPTAKFKFVKRETRHHIIPDCTTTKISYTGSYRRILQQWWADIVEIGMITKELRGEWRDVEGQDE